MHKRFSLSVISFVAALVSSATFACGELGPKTTLVLTCNALSADKVNRCPGVLAAGNAEESDSPSVPPSTDKATMHGNCTVLSEDGPHRRSAPIRSAEGRYVRLTRAPAKRHSSRKSLRDGTPLISFHCLFDAPESRLEVEP